MKFTLHRNAVIATKTGRAIEFVKGVATHVPPQCWPDVQAAGAIPEDELPEPEQILPATPQGEDRAQKIIDAINAMVIRNEREDFTASGAPHCAVLSRVVGFNVDVRERDDIWQKMRNEE